MCPEIGVADMLINWKGIFQKFYFDKSKPFDWQKNLDYSE